MTNGNSNLDEQLAQLVQVTRLQGENITRLGENITRLGQEQRERFDQTLAELRELKEISRQQAESIRQFTVVFAEQARAITQLSQTAREAVQAFKRSAQASEAAAIVAQNNQNAIRDLIEELRRQGR